MGSSGLMRVGDVGLRGLERLRMEMQRARRVRERVRISSWVLGRWVWAREKRVMMRWVDWRIARAAIKLSEWDFSRIEAFEMLGRRVMILASRRRRIWSALGKM